MNLGTLELNGIFFQEDPACKVRVLPPHVVALRSALLDFDCTIPDRLSLSTDEGIRHVDEIYRDMNVSEFERAQIAESIARYKHDKEDTEKLHKGDDREAEWQTFFFNKFFGPLANEMRVVDKDSRRISRIKFYYDYFEHAQGRPWPLFGASQGFRTRERLLLSMPKPDWVAFYPIYDFVSGDRIPTSERWRWRNSPKDSIVENFSLRTLEHLAQHGLESNTAGLFRKYPKKPVILSDCICFPWLIVEHKRAGNKASECYCQAANAGTAVVMMLQTLSKYIESKLADKHVPPVVTMTTVDKIVRVWITYSCDTSSGDETVKKVKFKMDCIWKGI